jgi:mannose/fructose/N-acetylgalactosamine-specific phosphotransferase system component IIC
MKTIIVINDGSSAAANASKLALQVAQAVQANILVANTYKISTMARAKVMAGHNVSYHC